MYAWRDHFRMEGVQIVGLTAIGRATAHSVTYLEVRLDFAVRNTAFVEQAPMGTCHPQLRLKTLRGATRRSCLPRGDMGRESGL